MAASDTGAAQLRLPIAGDPIAIFKTNYGELRVRLLPEDAPKAVENFSTHAKNGYYDGLTFHRVINHFMIQGGRSHRDRRWWGKHLGNGF